MSHLEQTNRPAELMPFSRIRVETALSRFPIHRLSKRGNIAIDLQRLTESGEADFKWEVTYNVKHGQPGPLAYKVDTLLVNRRIDEASRPLPEVVKLGSLSAVCLELGLRVSGTNTNDVKRALHQNASAYITAKIRYKQKNGRERWGEIGYTRYSVVFTGENLPDGRTADAVYVVLNPSYRDLLNHVEVRPLDYDYLFKLSPGAQRLYEILSFPMYGAVLNARPRAKLIYSDYCLYAPQNRYFDFEHVKKQMYKVHAPHRESGYIAKIDLEETSDRDGNPDWEMWYTPGPRAIAEHQAFSRRGLEPGTPASHAVPPKIPVKSPQQQSLPLTEYEPVVVELTRRGIAEKKVRELLSNLEPGQEVMDQIEWTDATISKAPAGKFHNPPGLYVAVIRDNIPPPKNFVSTRKRRLWEESKQAQNVELARQAELEIQYEEYINATVDTYLGELPVEQHEQMIADARQQLKRTYRTMTEAQLTAMSESWVRAQVKNGGRVQVMALDQFCNRKVGPGRNSLNRKQTCS